METISSKPLHDLAYQLATELSCGRDVVCGAVMIRCHGHQVYSLRHLPPAGPAEEPIWATTIERALALALWSLVGQELWADFGPIGTLQWKGVKLPPWGTTEDRLWLEQYDPAGLVRLENAYEPQPCPSSTDQSDGVPQPSRAEAAVESGCPDA